VCEETRAERLEPQRNPVEVRLGEVQHCYPANAVPAGLAPPAHAERFLAPERVLDPRFDPARDYVPRRDRPEWDVVSFRGQERVRKGERVGARWIRMGDVSEAAELWLVR
jgi:hypothetical protein